MIGYIRAIHKIFYQRTFPVARFSADLEEREGIASGVCGVSAGSATRGGLRPYSGCGEIEHRINSCKNCDISIDCGVLVEIS